MRSSRNHYRKDLQPMKKITINGSNYSYHVVQRNLSYLLLLLGINNNWESFDNVNIKNLYDNDFFGAIPNVDKILNIAES